MSMTMTPNARSATVTTPMTWIAEGMGAGTYADVNGLHLFYEIHGTGKPLVLLHGGLGARCSGRSSRRRPPTTRSSSPTCRATGERPTSTGRSTSG
jgi:hypothetical protein